MGPAGNSFAELPPLPVVIEYGKMVRTVCWA
jgi:hypothetical protein